MKEYARPLQGEKDANGIGACEPSTKTISVRDLREKRAQTRKRRKGENEEQKQQTENKRDHDT